MRSINKYKYLLILLVIIISIIFINFFKNGIIKEELTSNFIDLFYINNIEIIGRDRSSKIILSEVLGPYENKSVDYPDFAKKLAKRVKTKKSDIGILVCGSGTGMAISANKIKDIRAAVCYNPKSTRLSRQHNNANIIALGARLTKKSLSLKLVDLFLKTKFDGGRHLKRVKKI